VKRRVLVIAILAGLVLAGAAGAYVGRVLTVSKGNQADFVPSNWFCANHGTTVTCGNGDAYPFLDMTSSKKGLTIRVHTLASGGHSQRRSGGGSVYSFTAFK
jgi:hypothetical protein